MLGHRAPCAERRVDRGIELCEQYLKLRAVGAVSETQSGDADAVRRILDRPPLGPVARAAASVGLGDGYLGGRHFRPERTHLLATWADDTPAGLGYLVPDAGDLTKGFGDDEPGVV